MSKKMSEIDRMRKYYSVKCNCGHRVCFARKTIKFEEKNEKENE